MGSRNRLRGGRFFRFVVVLLWVVMGLVWVIFWGMIVVGWYR